MGEHADDLIDAGMMELGATQGGGWDRRRGGRNKPHYASPKQPRELIKAPENVNSDHFTWWFDEKFETLCEKIKNGDALEREIVSMAWYTVIDRFKLTYVPTHLDKYGFHEWYNKKKFGGCSPYEIADMAWMEATERALKYLNEK